MHSPKASHSTEKPRPSSISLTHPASSPGPRHTTRPPDHPLEHPSPSKRQRHASTPSSSSSLPSTPSRDRSGVDFYQARFESTMRLKDAWAQLAQRYARPLDEDDIIDLRSEKILKDRGVVRNLGAQLNFGGGNASLLDELGNDASSEAGGAPSEDEDEEDEIDAFAHSPRAPHVQSRFEAQLRRVKPLQDADSEDDDDLRDFLEAERRTREEFGPVDDDFGEDLAELQGQDVVVAGEDLADEVISEVIEIFDSSEEEQDEDEDEGEDEDELGGWEHDESNAIYEVVRTPAPEVIEIFDTPPTSPPSSPLPTSDPFSRSSSARAGST